MNKLAVIIPAFKKKYFNLALNSLANQTDDRFTVYVGDDNSPDDLESIVNEYNELLSIKYIKFSDNIGAKNLVNQWERCVKLSSSEEWLWLFSDDDIASNKCVEMFYHTFELKNESFDVFRFNTVVIDSNGEIKSETHIGPEVESSAEMAYNLLLGRRGNSMPDHIFSRKIYNQTGGFVFTQYAQAADWATSIKFSKENGICIIPEAKLYWRLSGINISSLAGSNKIAMLKGHIDFLKWLVQHFRYLIDSKDDTITYKEIKIAGITNLTEVIKWHYKGFNIKMIYPIFKLLYLDFKIPFYRSLKILYKML